jgi:outer membrane protein assembly factor BamB
VGTHDGRVVAVDWQKGEIVWTYKDPKREHPYHASAAVTGEFVIVGGQDKQLHCIDRQQGTRVWVFAARGQINSSPVVVGERVFFGSADGNIYAVGLRDGKERWKYNAGKDVTAAPAVGEGCLVIGTEDGNGRIYCFGSKE